jgi:hypothetical protein
MAASNKPTDKVSKPVKAGKKKSMPNIQVNKPTYILRKDAMKKVKIT